VKIRKIDQSHHF